MGNCFHMFNAQCGMKIGVLHCPTQMETNRSIPATGDIFIGLVPIRHSVIVLVSEPRCIWGKTRLVKIQRPIQLRVKEILLQKHKSVGIERAVPVRWRRRMRSLPLLYWLLIIAVNDDIGLVPIRHGMIVLVTALSQTSQPPAQRMAWTSQEIVRTHLLSRNLSNHNYAAQIPTHSPQPQSRPLRQRQRRRVLQRNAHLLEVRGGRRQARRWGESPLRCRLQKLQHETRPPPTWHVWKWHRKIKIKIK